MPPKERVEPILKLLCGCLIFFTAVLFAAEVWFASDSQLFQVVAGVLTSIAGAFLARIKPSKGETGATGASGSNAPPVVNVVQDNKQ